MTTTTSRTGLVPSPTRSRQFVRKKRMPTECMPRRFEASPMSLSLRPYGGLFNPFAKGCSVLCNHPAPTAVKDIIQQLKTSLAVEGRNVQLAKEKYDTSVVVVCDASDGNPDNIPDDLFKRYTDTDSRPLTPPSVASGHTRASTVSFMHNRRCITPELGKNEIIQKRKKIILDLRRSHSQETLFYWKPASDLSQSGGGGGGGVSVGGSESKPKSAGANEEGKTRRQKSDEQRPKTSMALQQTQNAGDATDSDETAAAAGPLPLQTCINDRGVADDEDVRRGKKRKKLKAATQATTTFHLSEDPETQVATLGPDSLNPSTRPSLIPNAAGGLPGREKRESEPVLLKGSFLTDDAFQALKTELDIDVIENTFGRYLNRAMREAIKYLPPKPPKPLPNNKTDEDKPQAPFMETKMPRKFSKSATRFEFPLNLKILETLTPIGYLSQYVWIHRQRKQLYKRVFLRYLIENPSHADDGVTDAPTTTTDVNNTTTINTNTNTSTTITTTKCSEYVERKMSLLSLTKALEDVLEFYGTAERITQIQRLLDYESVKSLEVDFRTWCGISAFAERCALDDPNGTDSCDELEKVDFGTMEERIDAFQVPKNLLEIFQIIRRTHNVKF